MMSLTGCRSTGIESVDHAEGHVTVFSNDLGDVITISKTGIVVAGTFYAAENCSTSLYNCYSYGKLFAFIAPKVCHKIYGFNWRSGGIKAILQAIVPHTNSAIFTTSLNARFGYTFEWDSGRGITSIFYDQRMNIGSDEPFRFAQIPSSEMARISFYHRNGPPFLACEPVAPSVTTVVRSVDPESEGRRGPTRDPI